MNSFIESAIGLSDLPIALLSLIFSILSKKNRNIEWSIVFLFTGISAIIGTVAHTFAFSDLMYKLIWTVLYIFLFDTVRRYTLLFTNLVRKSESVKKYLIAIEVSLYIVCLFFLFVIEKYDILIFVFFSAVCLCLLIYKIFKYRNRNKYFLSIFCLVSVSVIMQILSNNLRILIVAEHLFIFSALFVVYQMSKLNENS